MSIEVGAIVEGEITGITKFGAFMTLPENKTGLIHISEVSNAYVKDVHDFLKEHDKVKAKVVSVDAKGKISLSIKQLEVSVQNKAEAKSICNQNNEDRPKRPFNPKPRPQANKAVGPVSFEDKLSRFLKDSDDRMLDLKRNTESKRGGRGARRER